VSDTHDFEQRVFIAREEDSEQERREARDWAAEQVEWQMAMTGYQPQAEFVCTVEPDFMGEGVWVEVRGVGVGVMHGDWPAVRAAGAEDLAWLAEQRR
jgi:hypothetical protein